MRKGNDMKEKDCKVCKHYIKNPEKTRSGYCLRSDVFVAFNGYGCPDFDPKKEKNDGEV